MSCPFAQGAKYHMHGILRNEMKKSVIHEIDYIIVFSWTDYKIDEYLTI